MATTIPLTNISNQVVLRDEVGTILSITGDGIFDKLLTSIGAFIEMQEQHGKLTQGQYAEIISQSIPIIVNASVDFSLKSLVTAVEIDKGLVDLAVKNYQLAEMMPAEKAKMEADVLIAQSESELKAKELAIKEFEFANMLPLQMALTTAQVVAMEADASIKLKELEIKDKDILIKGEELKMKAIELDVVEQELVIKTIQADAMGRELAIKEREADASILLSGAELQIKSYQISDMLPAEKAKMEADIIIAQSGIELKEQEVLVSKQEVLIKTAQLDIMGREISLKESESSVNIIGTIAETAVKESQKTMIDQQNLTETQQTAKAVYEVTNMLPLQKDGMIAENAVKVGQRSMIDQQMLTEAENTAKTVYEVANILPAQKDGIIAETAVKASQKVMIDQQELTETQQTAKATYEVSDLLPLQKGLLTEQVQLEARKLVSMIVDDTLKEAQKVLVDQQNLTEIQQTAKAVEEKKIAIVTKIAKDKEASLLGLDDTAKMSRLLQTGSKVYTPHYAT